MDFTINENSQLIDTWFNNKISVTQKLAVLDDKLISIDDKIKQLKEMKKTIAQFKKDITEDNC